MKQQLTFFILALVFFSCKEISFREPQPKGKKNLSQIPLELRGRYLAQNDDGEISKDTIVITAKGYRFGYFVPAEKGNDKIDEGMLSDSLVLKSYKGFYFLSFNENPEWLLRVFRREKNGNIIYMSMGMENVDFKDFVKKLGKEIRIDSLMYKDEMLYQIDPSPKQLVDLINKGYFTRTVLKKIE
jgi:hypothetical protein